VLSGGSAFGLDAAAGVMAYLEEHGIGYETLAGKVPIVCGASIFDLVVGDPKARPDRAMGYAACVDAFRAAAGILDGNHGAGIGATVGKYLGPKRMMKSGLGTAAVRIGGIEIGAIAAVNAMGDVIGAGADEILAGMLAPDGKSICGTSEALIEGIANGRDVLSGGIAENTTLVCLVTNASMNKREATRVATLAHDGMARAVRPVHTSVDGDAVFAMASGKVKADADAVACIAADMTAEAIRNAVLAAAPAYGLKAAEDFR
jgi:L-aminopeptidase/D-esterase-like protein